MSIGFSFEHEHTGFLMNGMEYNDIPECKLEFNNGCEKTLSELNNSDFDTLSYLDFDLSMGESTEVFVPPEEQNYDEQPSACYTPPPLELDDLMLGEIIDVETSEEKVPETEAIREFLLQPQVIHGSTNVPIPLVDLTDEPDVKPAPLFVQPIKDSIVLSWEPIPRPLANPISELPKRPAPAYIASRMAIPSNPCRIPIAAASYQNSLQKARRRQLAIPYPACSTSTRMSMGHVFDTEKMVRNNRLLCEGCYRFYNTFAGLSNHMRTCTVLLSAVVVHESQKPSQCGLCGKIYKGYESELHRIVHSITSKCERGEYTYAFSGSLHAPSLISDRRHPCSKCSVVSNDYLEYTAHLLEEHKVLIAYSCAFCRSISGLSLGAHKKHVEVVYIDNNVIDTAEAPRFEIPCHCKQPVMAPKFAKKAPRFWRLALCSNGAGRSFMVHMMTSTEEAKKLPNGQGFMQICAVCDEVCALSSLHEHVFSAHLTHRLTFVCRLCAGQFHSWKSMVSHQVLFHLVSSPENVTVMIRFEQVGDHGVR